MNAWSTEILGMDIRSTPPASIVQLLLKVLSDVLSMALLAAQPDHDVVIFGHVGLEGVAELGGLRRRLPLRDPVVVRWWVHPRSSLPRTPDEQVDWLNHQWRELDAWIVSVTSTRYR